VNPDSLGMFAATGGLADQLRSAAAAAWSVDLPPAEGITSVVLMGMGGSGIGGDVAAAVLGADARVPVVVSKHYECPGFVGPDTLAVALSFSGNTEETVAAATAAAQRGARVVVVAAGGRLVELAGRLGAPHVPLDASIPMPRAGIGALSVVPMVLLDRLGLAGDVAGQLDAAVAQVERRLATPGWEAATPGRDDTAEGGGEGAALLARRIGRRLPVVYGGGALGETAAWRWKGQFNENPKVASFANRIPELTHNEVCGWAQHGDVTRQVMAMVLLRHDHEHPQAGRRFDLVEEICDEVVGDIFTVRAEGTGPFAQFMDLVVMGDLTTLHLAVQSGVDPGPVPILDEIKERLADS